MEKKDEVIQQLKGVLSKEKEILFAYLHGSFLSKGKFNDVDIALYLDEKSMKEIEPVDFEISLSLKIEKAIRLPVDVKILNFAPLSFGYRTSLGYLLFSRNELKREEFLCKTWSEYFDFLPLSLLYLKEVLSG